MNKSISLFLVCALMFAASLPVFAQAKSSSDNKVVKGAKSVGRGIMWGPKKIGNGLKAAGSKTKKVFTGNK